METVQTKIKNYGKIIAVNNENSGPNGVYMEKIRSGQSFLYREGGCPSMVVEARMKEAICESSLIHSLELALSRYPYLTRKIIEKDGTLYLVKNPLPFILDETKVLHSLGSSLVNYHLIDVTYYEKTIYISYHHGLCDGRGIMPFIKTLIYYYCTFKYRRKLNVKGIRLAGEPILQGETAEPFGEHRQISETRIPEIHKEGFALPDSLNSIGKNRYYRYEVKIRHDTFMKFARENNATPAITAALLISKAIKKIHPETNKPILCNLASDLRSGINMEYTYKNCVGSLGLPYTDEFDGLSFNEQAAACRKIIKEYKNADNLKGEVNKQINLYDKLDEISSYEEKKQMMAFFNNLITNTFILSYVGQSELGDCEKYIDSFHTYISGTTGFAIQMLSVGEFITLDFMQSFHTSKYRNSFAEILEELVLEYSISDILEFSTPKDSIMSGAS